MLTQLFTVTSKDSPGIAAAAEILRGGGLVAIPTETVYGLAANALDPEAVKKIFAAKGRPADNPLIVHIAYFSQLNTLVDEIPQKAVDLANAFWPGPLTLVLKKSGRVPEEVSGGLGTVAVRMPAHPIARAIISAAGVPLAAPSANLSGRPSPTAAQHVTADLDGRIDAIVNAGPCEIGLESTVLSLIEDAPKLLRPGGVTVEELEPVIGKIFVDGSVLSPCEGDSPAPSPGMKYRHYAPQTRLTVLRGSRDKYIDYVNKFNKDVCALCFEGDAALLRVPAVTFGREDDPVSQAARLFDALRELDCTGAQRAFARCPGGDGVGLAVLNRLLRAAAFDVVDLGD